MDELIKKYLKKDDPDVLHDLRIYARKTLSKLALENKTDSSLKKLLKKSSKLRDTDVLMKICKNKKIKKYLKKKHKKLRKKFIKFLKKFKSEIIELKEKQEDISLEKCKKILSETFLNKDDKTLHKIRIEVKKCRYTNPHLEKYLKKIQDYLGKAHDYYNCEKMMKKFGLNPKKVIKKKEKFIKKAEKKRIKLLHQISTLHSSL